MNDQLSLRLAAAAPRLPVSLRPMLARAATAPFDSTEHLFEPGWGGARALAFVEPDAEAPPGRRRDLRLLDGRGRDLSAILPELDGLPERVAATSAVLDGELVVVDGNGRGDARALARRLVGADGRATAYLVFDLLYLDGRPLLGLPLERRRAMLRAILSPGDAVIAVPAIVGEGRALFDAVLAQGLAGMTARELRSPYLPGIRSRLWRWVAAAGADGRDRGGRPPGSKRDDAGEAPGSRPGDGPDEGPAASAGPALALIRRLPFDDD